MSRNGAPSGNESAAARAVYEAWHTRAESVSSVADEPWHRLVLQQLRREDVAGRSILEIGCGRGELSCALAAGAAGCLPAWLVGADFATSAVRFAARRASHLSGLQPRFAVADILRMPFRSDTFDAVISCETLEHVTDPAAAVREIHRVLVPGGRLFLTVPNYLGIMGVYRIYLRLRRRRFTEGDQPICHFTTLPRTVFWLYRAGFRLIAADAAGHYVLRPRRAPLEANSGWRDRWLWPFGLHSVLVAEKVER